MIEKTDKTYVICTAEKLTTKVKVGQLWFKYLKPIYKVFRNSMSVLCNIVPRMNKIHILH